MSSLSARAGWDWLKQGFAMFRKQPGILTMIIFSNLLVTVLLSALPLVGMILTFVFIPGFCMAIQQACLLIDDGQRVGPGVLLTGFRKGAIGPLCKLGLVYLGAFVVLLLAVSPWIDMTALQQAAKIIESKGAPVIDRGTQLAVLVFFFLFGLTMLALAFAPALTDWKGMKTFKSIFYSVVAIVGSWRPVLAMLMSWLGIYWVLIIIVGLVFGRSQFVYVIFMWLNLISALILQCAVFAAYKQIMGTPDLHPEPA